MYVASVGSSLTAKARHAFWCHGKWRGSQSAPFRAKPESAESCALQPSGSGV